MVNATAIITREQHGKSELSLYDFATKIIVESSQKSSNPALLVLEIQRRDDSGRATGKFPADVDLITRACGRTKDKILLEIESVVCVSGNSEYLQLSSTTFFMNNDISSYSQEEIDSYFENVAASSLDNFEKLAEANGFRRSSLAAGAEDIGNLPNPYRLSAFANDRASLLLIKHEAVPRIGKVTGSPAVISVSLFTPDESNN